MIRAVLGLSIATFALAAGWPVQASPALPGGVRAMIDAAIASGDAAKVETVVALARQTNPQNTDEIAAIMRDWEEARANEAALAARRTDEAIRSASLFGQWSGSGEFGAFQSGGNSDAIGVTAALKLKRKGINWSHLLRARVDFQKSEGVTNREQYLFAYEPRYQIDDSLFAFGLARVERDRLQGFVGRYAVSGGLGYRLVNSDGLSFAVKAGPAYRVTDFRTGTSEERFAGLFGIDFDWKISERLALSQDANLVAESGSRATVIVDAANTSIDLVTRLDAKLSGKISTRLSYAVDYNSDPPANAASTDTTTRFSVVYDF